MEFKRKPLDLAVKKSQGFSEFFIVIAVLLGVVLTILILNKVVGEIKDPLDEGLSGAMPVDSSVNVTEILDDTQGSSLLFDKLLPFLIIGLFSFILITAGAVMKHPIMIIVGIIILAVVIFLAAVYSNLYQSIVETDDFSDTDDELPVQNAFMKYLPYILFIMAIGVTLAILFGKSSGMGGAL